MPRKETPDIYGDHILHSWRNGITKSPWVEQGRPWDAVIPNEFPRTLDYPEASLAEMCDQTAQKFKEKSCIQMIPGDTEYSYMDLKLYSDRFASALSDRFAIGKGKSVGIMTWNSPEYVFSIFGVLKTGASCTLMNPLVPLVDVKYMIENAQIIDTLILDESLYAQMKNISQIKNFVTLGGKEFEGSADFWQLVKEASKSTRPRKEVDPKKDMAALIYTGGTTGRPKGVVLTHYNLLANALQCAYFGRKPKNVQSALGKGVTLIILPICHISGFSMLLTALYEGHTNIMTRHFDVAAICAAIQKYKVTKFPVVPTLISYLVGYPDLCKYDFSSIQICGSGAFSLPVESAKKFEEITGVKVIQGYGMTELCAAAASNPIWDKSAVIPESVGIPIIDTDLRVVDPDTGKDVPQGQVGEAWWRGPQLMKEYWNAPEVTRNALQSGWLRSGDLVRLSDKGYVFLVERLKDIIKYKGYKIFPEEIEMRLLEHPAVKECAVIGVERPAIGEMIKAFIVLKKNYWGKVTEQELIEWCKDRLGPMKYPRELEFVDEIPKTLVGKPSRKLLREGKYRRRTGIEDS